MRRFTGKMTLQCKNKAKYFSLPVWDNETINIFLCLYSIKIVDHGLPCYRLYDLLMIVEWIQFHRAEGTIKCENCRDQWIENSVRWC